MRRRTSPQSSPLQKEERRIAETSFSAVLLAGGESRRMGNDKATVLFRGTPLWQIQLELLRQLTPQEIFVSARSDPEWRPADIQFVADDPPSRGPLSGLAASLDRMSTSHLLALAIDMPRMSNKYLEFLCAQIEPGRGVVPKIGDRAEPLAAIYPREAAIDFHHALTGTDFSLQTLVCHLLATGRLRDVSIVEQESKLFRNVNEQVDLQSV
jgi:molybdenum cofactor guanylyltransferase